MSHPNPKHDPENVYPHDEMPKYSALKGKFKQVKKPKKFKTNIGNKFSDMAEALKNKMNQ